MAETTIIGIDCATDDAKVGLARAVMKDGQCTINFAGVCSSEKEVAEELADWIFGHDRVLLALDAPLGWPQAMGRALAKHRAGEALPDLANDLFRRETDRFVRARLGKQSLDVGADRIARTAHSALKLLTDLRQRSGLAIPLAWGPSYAERLAAIEVYPAATLIGYGITVNGYKKKEAIAERKALIGSLRLVVDLPEEQTAMERSADALDAGVCVLAGADFLLGQSYSPPDEELARHEGWIWVRPRR